MIFFHILSCIFFSLERVVQLRSQFFALPLSTTLTILGSYAFGYPLQLFWFSKIAKGLIKVLSAAGGGKKGKKGS